MGLKNEVLCAWPQAPESIAGFYPGCHVQIYISDRSLRGVEGRLRRGRLTPGHAKEQIDDGLAELLGVFELEHYS